MENKSLWQIFKGSMVGIDGEGSAKRFASLFSSAILLGSLLAVYEYAIFKAVHCAANNEAQLMLIKMYPEIFWTITMLILILLGFAVFEFIANIAGKFWGKNKE